jgi:hypothetical protein
MIATYFLNSYRVGRLLYRWKMDGQMNGLRPDVSVRSSFQETFEQESDVYVQSASLRESESESDDNEDPNSYVNDCYRTIQGSALVSYGMSYWFSLLNHSSWSTWHWSFFTSWWENVKVPCRSFSRFPKKIISFDSTLSFFLMIKSDFQTLSFLI